MNRDPYQTWQGLGGRDLAQVAAAARRRIARGLLAAGRPRRGVRRQLDAYCLQ